MAQYVTFKVRANDEFRAFTIEFSTPPGLATILVCE